MSYFKFAGNINLRPAVTTEKDWNASWKELDESAERDATCNLIEEKQSEVYKCTIVTVGVVCWRHTNDTNS